MNRVEKIAGHVADGGSCAKIGVKADNDAVRSGGRLRLVPPQRSSSTARMSVQAIVKVYGPPPLFLATIPVLLQVSCVNITPQVICCAVRTALGKSKKGSFRTTTPEDLLAACYQGIIKKTGVDPALIADAQIGNVLQPGAGAVSARVSQFMGGLPCGASAVAVNRQCSSGLQTIASVGAAIQVLSDAVFHTRTVGVLACFQRNSTGLHPAGTYHNGIGRNGQTVSMAVRTPRRL